MEATAEKEAPAEHKVAETATPVMDVKPPKYNETPAGKSEDVVAPPPPEEEGSEETTQPPQPQAAIQVAKPPKQKGSGVGLAVFGTVVIVLGLAALAVYAYVQTNK